MFVAGPPVVKRLGQDLTKQELGGADIQTRAGGVDHAVDTEEEAFELRQAFSVLSAVIGVRPAADHALHRRSGARGGIADEGGAAQSPPGLQDAPDHRRRGRQGLVLRGQRQFRPPDHRRACAARRPRGAAARQRSLSLWRIVDGGGVPEGGALGRFRRNLPSAGGLSDGLPGLHDRARGREVGDHPSRRARDGRGQPDHRALVHHHRAQRLRRRRRRASAGQPLFDALCLAVGLLGLAAAGRRHRGGLSRRHRRCGRSGGEAEGDRGSPQQAALAVPLRREILGRGSHRSPQDALAAVRIRAAGRADPHAGPPTNMAMRP